MLERLVEYWLDSANERSFQGPFCQMLASQGHTIVHMTRHGEMEMGKDVISVAPDGVICAYQLKTVAGPRITLSDWRNGMESQLLDLVVQPVVHPSLPKGRLHRSYLATNRDIDEPVQHAIAGMNTTLRRKRVSRNGLHTVVRGEMLQMARSLQTGLWPSEQKDTISLLSMFLSDGRGSLPLPKLADLIEGVLDLNSRSSRTTRSEKKRRLASAALLSYVALSNYTAAENYVREVQGLTVLLAYILAHAEKHQLCRADWESAYKVVTRSIYDRLMDLQKELSQRSHLVEGEPWSDGVFIGARATMCLGYMGILGLWRQADGIEPDATDDHIRDFCDSYRKRLEYWGESATPFALALFWYLENASGAITSDLLIRDLLHVLCTNNKPESRSPVPSAYYTYEEIIEHLPPLGGLPIHDAFAGRSQTATALLHLLVRRNLKQSAKQLWPDYTQIMHEEYIPKPTWGFYRWRCRAGGTNRMVHPVLTQQWDTLRGEALEERGRMVPRLLRSHPILLLLVLCVYPHRLAAQVVRWLDSKLGKTWE